MLAKAEIAVEKWQEGEVHLDEALQIAMKMEDFRAASEYLRLAGQVRFSSRDKQGALERFSKALALMRTHGKPRDVADCVGTVARFYMEQGLKDEARKFLTEELELGEQNGLLETCADARLALSELEDGPDAETKKEVATKTEIVKLEQLLLQTQVNRQRAFLMVRIGFLHGRLRQWAQALDWFNRAKEHFDEIGDIHGVAKSYQSIADIRRAQEKPQEEIEALQSMLKLVIGKSFPDLIAAAKNAMGVHSMRHGDLHEAKHLFEEAEDVCQRNNLPDELRHAVRENLERVELWLKARKPAAMDFAQLVRELHEWVEFFPEAKDSILRFWYYCRDVDLYANYTSVGLKWYVVEDNTNAFLELAEWLSPYSGLTLQAVNTAFPGIGLDLVPFPKDRELPDGVANGPYHLTSSETQSKTTGNTGRVLVGQARGLPAQAHRLMLDLTAAEIIAKKVQFFPSEPKNASSRLLEDLRLAKELSLVPMYVACLPNPEDAEVMAQVDITIPAISLPVETKVLRQITRKLVRLLSLAAQEMPTALREVADAFDDFRIDSHATQSLRLKAYVLRFPLLGKQETHIAMVRLPVE